MAHSSPPPTRRSVVRLHELVGFSLRMVWASARAAFSWLMTFQIVNAVILALQVLSVQWVLDGILSVETGGARAVIAPVLILAGLTAASAVVGSVQNSLGRFVGESVSRRMWGEILDVSTRVGLVSYEDPGFFDHLERVRGSALTRPLQVTNGLIGCVGALAAGIGLGATLFGFSPLLLPLLLVGAIPLLFTSRWESRREYAFNVDQTTKIRQRTYMALLLTGRDEAKEVRSYGLPRTLRARYDSLYDTYLRQLANHLKRRGLLNATGQGLSALALVATLLVLVWLIADGAVTVAQAGAALVAVRMLASQVQALMGGVQSIFESGLFIDDLQDFLARKPAEPPDSAPAQPLDFDRIVAEDVQFTYPGKKQPALDGVSMKIDRGEIVALVGENGSGKSTLAKLVAGLYEPSTGQIRWDGMPVTPATSSTVRASTAVIFQDFVRYAVDARSNIAFGRPDVEVDQAEVERAAEASGAAAAIDSLPDGYDTTLTRLFDGGQDLSGGQWQRVAIARAFYKDSPLVILDEPSAALDPRAEYDLFASLRETLRGRSALVISHRFSTVRNADRIYVLDQGRVIESGSHDELMRQSGVYAELFRLQASTYLADEAPGEETASGPST